MTLYETIFKRRSVRKYEREPLTDDAFTDIRNHLNGLRQLDGQNARLEIVSRAAVSNDKAPHYILAYCESKDAAFINVGYCLQEMDLYIQSKGFGSLWLGTAKPKDKETVKDESAFGYCIMLAFGKTDVPQRNGEKDFNRLEISKISDTDNDIVRAARLAPSAMNSQPWRLALDNDKVIIGYCGRGLLKGVLKKKLSKIDLGIITKHTELALIESGKQVTAIQPETNGNSFSVAVLYD